MKEEKYRRIAGHPFILENPRCVLPTKIPGSKMKQQINASNIALLGYLCLIPQGRGDSQPDLPSYRLPLSRFTLERLEVRLFKRRPSFTSIVHWRVLVIIVFPPILATGSLPSIAPR